MLLAGVHNTLHFKIITETVGRRSINERSSANRQMYGSKKMIFIAVVHCKVILNESVQESILYRN